jgi:hypothetical protein
MNWDVHYTMNREMNYFLLTIGVEISDHPLTVGLSKHPLYISLQMGDIIMQGDDLH